MTELGTCFNYETVVNKKKEEGKGDKTREGEKEEKRT